jgi:hypothetical protein
MSNIIHIADARLLSKARKALAWDRRYQSGEALQSDPAAVAAQEREDLATEQWRAFMLRCGVGKPEAPWRP